jgi:CRP-like cAMP-binding protein
VNDAKVAEYGPGSCFGELALIYNAKRAATIVATGPCTLWTLDLRTFRRMLATSSSSTTMACIEFLRKVPLLSNLSNEQVWV